MTTTVPVTAGPDLADDALDNPVWSSLTGAHAHLAEGDGLALRYPPDVSPFHAVADDADPAAWDDLARLVGPGGTAVLTARRAPAPPGWEVVEGGSGVQMTGEGVPGRPDAALVHLGPADADDMLALVARTRPGPFLPRTVVLGGYRGLRAPDGTLVAMAGTRLRPGGHVEISAVCTDESHRGRGLATRLVEAVVDDVRSAGAVPVLHAAAQNAAAIRVYERLGFRVVRRPRFELLRAPGPAAG